MRVVSDAVSVRNFSPIHGGTKTGSDWSGDHSESPLLQTPFPKNHFAWKTSYGNPFQLIPFPFPSAKLRRDKERPGPIQWFHLDVSCSIGMRIHYEGPSSCQDGGRFHPSTASPLPPPDLGLSRG